MSFWIERKENNARVITLAQGGDLLLPIFLAGIIAAFIGVNMVASNPGHRRSYTESMIAQVAKGLELYRRDHGAYPQAADWRGDLVSGGYVAKVPEDAWGRPLIYESTGTAYRLMSLGADGHPGGRDQDADIIHLSAEFTYRNE